MLDPLYLTTIPIGFGYFSLGDYEKTVKYINLGLADNPERIPFLAFTAAAYALSGDEVEAKKALEKWLTNYEDGFPPDGQWLYYLYPFKNLTVSDRLMEGLIKAGYTADLSNYHRVDEANKLNGQEIGALLYGKKQTGYLFGLQWSVFRNKDGDAQYTGLWGETDKGKSWIEDGTNCNQFEINYDDLDYCCDIYRNPRGGEVTKSEYLSVCDFAVIPFSVEE